MSDFEEGPRAVAPWVLGALAAVCIVGGVAIVVTGKSAVQIEGLVAFLVAAVLIAGAALASALHRIRRDLWDREQARQAEADERTTRPRRPI
jgi:hypothetical protein